MATKIWRGLQGILQGQQGYTCNASIGDTYSLVHNKKVISYTAVTGDTATTIAAALVAAAGNSNTQEWTELTVTSNGAVVNILGPADGAPFTVTAVVTGSATLTAGTTVTPISPFDVTDAANYDAGVAPVSNDLILCPRDAADMRYNLAGLASLTGLTIQRDLGGPNIGLPDYRAAGYREYRQTQLKVKAGTFNIFLDGTEGKYALRFDNQTIASTVNITGIQGGQLDSEAIEMTNLGTASVVNCSSGSIALPAGTVVTLNAANSAVRVESAVTLSGTVELLNCSSRLRSSWTTNLAVTNGVCEVASAATGPCTVIGGTVNWTGSGNLNSPFIGDGGTIDTSGGATAIAVTGYITKMHPNASFVDSFTRVSRPYTIESAGAGLSGLDVGRDFKITVDNRP